MFPELRIIQETNDSDEDQTNPTINGNSLSPATIPHGVEGTQ